MTFPLPRLTVRRLMVLVALSAFVPMAIRGWCWWTIRQRYLVAARQAAEDQAMYRKSADDHEEARRIAPDGSGPPPICSLCSRFSSIPTICSAIVENTRDRLEYSSVMRRRYEAAAARPWGPEPEDPGLPMLQLQFHPDDPRRLASARSRPRPGDRELGRTPGVRRRVVVVPVLPPDRP